MGAPDRRAAARLMSLAAIVLLGSAVLVGPIGPAASAATTTAARPDAARRHSGTTTDTKPTDVFTGNVATRTKSGGTRRRPVFDYQVNVSKVFLGDDITTRRVRVRTLATVEPCVRTPLKPHGSAYAFELTRQGSLFVAGACADIQFAGTATVDVLTNAYGQPRAPVQGSTQQDLPPVVTTPRDVGAPRSFTRTAAPGAALVLIGLLGLMLARRRR